VVGGYVEGATSSGYPEEWELDQLWTALKTLYPISLTVDEAIEQAGGEKSDLTREFLLEEIVADAQAAYDQREEDLGPEVLRELERRTAVVLESVTDPLLGLDGDGRLTLLNDAALQLLTRLRGEPSERETLIGANALSVLPALLKGPVEGAATTAQTERHAVDAGVSVQARDVLFATAGVALAVVAADWAVQVWQTRVTGRTGERLLYILRVKTFAQLQRLGLDYYERELAGRIMTRMTTDVDALSTFLQTGLTTAIVSLLSFFGVLIALLVLNAQLALVVLAVLPILIVATVVFRRRSSAAYTESRERVSAVNASLRKEGKKKKKS